MTNITIINGIAKDNFSDFEERVYKMTESNKDSISFDCFNIRDLDIKYCCGCWGCWVKTPGKCIYNDEMPIILKSVINSDLTVFISSVEMGFISACLKKTQDRMIPLIHPYIEIDNKECHHVKRYNKYPKLGLVLVDKDISSLSELDIITDIYERFSRNFKSEICFSLLSNGSVEELSNEINNIKWVP